ncbi:MAG TPA: glycogen synthase GlgA [Candidatus Omnitrophica bacterium]|nr:glycogen synthase GlgA [Candidatus Omnitrophota bacterium]
MKVLFCSSEVAPYAKTGGLADVAGSLPVALKEIGIDIRIVMPKYKCVNIEGDRDLLQGKVWVYFVDNKEYFHRDYLYSTPEGDYSDNLDRFVYYCKSVLEISKREGFSPDIIHCNDWQTALIPVYIKSIYSQDEFFKNTRTIFTIHNIAYQGLFPSEEWEKTSLPGELFSIQGLEYYGKINLMKGAILFSDYITTVSPTYSKEIQTPEYGFGMEGILKGRSDRLAGIINGIDYSVWNPAEDKEIPQNYDIKTIDKKVINKQYLQTEYEMEIGRDIPLIGAIGRLTDQKGWDLIAEVIDEICQLDLQLIILGTGEKKYHQLMEEIATKYPRNTSINLKFDPILAKKIYAGCDLFLMPSKFEPCGLGQLISYRYGTLPIARQIGGLADTIIDLTQNPKNGTGFLFREYSGRALVEAITRAINFYRNRKGWRNVMKKVMKLDYSWKNSARQYLHLYKEIKNLPTALNVR